MVSVKFEGKEIKGSPFTQDVLSPDFFGAGKRFEVLYDAKVHGYSNATFHQKCDQVNGTVTLVTLKNGAKFGGYNPDNWTGKGSVFKNAPTAFLFSLTDGKGSVPLKFALKQGCEGQALAGYQLSGPIFGGGLLLLVSTNHSFFLLNLIVEQGTICVSN